jgi:hypothetical protein
MTLTVILRLPMAAALALINRDSESILLFLMCRPGPRQLASALMNEDGRRTKRSHQRL